MARKKKHVTSTRIVEGKSWELIHGKVEDACRELPENSFDAVLCDPPYGLRFMGKKWDYSVPKSDVWEQVLRVCKPGAALIAFSATKTYHRMAVEIEDAGFVPRDMLAWLYGEGMPKALNVSKALDAMAGAERPVIGSRILTGSAAMTTAEKGGTYAANTRSAGRKKAVDVTGSATDLAREWEGYATNLKPAFEPAVLAIKPWEGTIAENVARWGVGALAIDACRIDWRGPESGWSKSDNYERLPKKDAEGRWPSNVVLDDEAAVMLDEQSGERRSTLTGKADPGAPHSNPSDVRPEGWFGTRTGGGSSVYADSGGAARFFYRAKVSPKERGSRNDHVTVKPIDLARYFARLIMPPRPGRILVPFAGSGSEMLGAMLAGWNDVVGIEMGEHEAEVCRWRVENARMTSTSVEVG